MLRGTQGMVNKLGHYTNVRGLWDGSPQLGRLGDTYCDAGYHYDASVDNCIPGDYASPGGYCDQPENASECNWINCDDPANAAVCGSFDERASSPTITTDQGNSQIWQNIINAAGRIATQVVQATSTQYQTRYGTYAYGTGPYSGLTPTLAQQYLASRSTFGGLNTTTMLLIGGGLLLVLMMAKR